ncbi:DUF3108 domain-containing protein [Cocleimonas sp. KMM 6892]|uniref:DUF3108 domain-containing protein n=1 Tax=unclassified Cocleimonas TaxID=2639732 RepID=UPI002DB9B9FA|nr:MULTISPECIES: DUF3108 domain-containing protein [unclassified Cocleimonas]MEB8431053.1 DUF3108 domain-containing protein [Cocleimonas sp. KMM 6892]MEC4714175.1 DUF3108 domain-containing protein [Cocleimonas sp. KMM 6895]MEC4743506.1 DUF3108 domain-containing protein [Cocleimonas sp. KMM 6896]
MRLATVFNTKKKALYTFLLSLILLSTQAAQALPKAFEADYSVAKGSMSLGNLNASLQYSGNRYIYSKSTKATGIAAMLTGITITEKTDGLFSGQTIVPQNYLFNQSRRSKSRIDKIHFNGKSAVGSYKDNKFNLAVQPGIQDRASLELVLANDIGSNKQQLNYTVVERGKVKQYNFQKLGNEQVQTPAGTFNTVKVKVVRTGNKRETVFWLAKEIDFVPVKIRHREKDDVITTVIRSYKKI